MVRLAPAALATVLGLLGCGPASVPRADFVRRGNAVCAASSSRIAQLAAPRGQSADRMAGYVDAYVAERRQELANLRRLGYPPAERRRLGRAYENLASALSAIERDPLSFHQSTLAAAAAQLRAAGLTACRP
jgi:hypothetical protein